MGRHGKQPAGKAPKPAHPPRKNPLDFRAATHNILLTDSGCVLSYPQMPENMTGNALLHVGEYIRDGSDEGRARLVKVLPPLPVELPQTLAAPTAESGRFELGGIQPVRVARRAGAAPDDVSPEAFEDPTEETARLELPLRLGILRACIVRQCLRAAAEGRRSCTVRFPRWCVARFRRQTAAQVENREPPEIEGDDYLATLQRELATRQFARAAGAPLSALAAHPNIGPHLTAEEHAMAEAERELPTNERPLALFLSWEG